MRRLLLLLLLGTVLLETAFCVNQILCQAGTVLETERVYGKVQLCRIPVAAQLVQAHRNEERATTDVAFL
uniref:Putative secreted protein n=1 Tax=Anopheles darlingi TaxID=43151 RepID=A0A2M4DNG7_ANODA